MKKLIEKNEAVRIARETAELVRLYPTTSQLSADVMCNVAMIIDRVADDIGRIEPTIDAVPVVRCKDCRYSEPMAKHGVAKFGETALNCQQCRGDDGYGYAGVSVIYPDDYCSDGAPR